MTHTVSLNWTSRKAYGVGKLLPPTYRKGRYSSFPKGSDNEKAQQLGVLLQKSYSVGSERKSRIYMARGRRGFTRDSFTHQVPDTKNLYKPLSGSALSPRLFKKNTEHFFPY